jgi:hypothetical protein
MRTSDDLFYRFAAYMLRRVAGSGCVSLIAGEKFKQACRWSRVARMAQRESDGRLIAAGSLRWRHDRT